VIETHFFNSELFNLLPNAFKIGVMQILSSCLGMLCVLGGEIPPSLRRRSSRINLLPY